MLSDEQILERMERDVEDIGNMPYDEESLSDPIDDLRVVVHPGYHEIVSGDGRLDRAQDYEEYCDNLYETVREALDQGDDLLALYPEGLEEEHRQFLEPYSEEAEWLPTLKRAGIPTDEGLGIWGEIYHRLEEGADVEVMGEKRESCYRYNILFLDTLQKRLEKDFKIIRGTSFG